MPTLRELTEYHKPATIDEAVKLLRRRKIATRPIGGGTTVRRSCTIVDAANGVVSFQWTTPDTAVVGSFYHEWEITWPTARPQTIPNSGYNLIVVEDDLD